MKKPEAGEWWGTAKGPLWFVIGKGSAGDIIVHNRDGDLCYGYSTLCDLTHLPYCTGWDWTEPDWVTQDRTHVRAGDWYKSSVVSGWSKSNYDYPSLRHGVDGYEVRCLREELPPLPPKRPQAGEWWSDDNTALVYVHGVTKTGMVLFEYATGGGGYIATKDFTHWCKHSPDCTGWES